MKLFHDDIRRPPQGWIWARTNADAIGWLRTGQVSEISLDHDLGGHELDPDAEDAFLYRGSSEDTGLKLVKFMIYYKIIPAEITIHSWNSVGASNMLRAFHNAGVFHAHYAPFTVTRHDRA